MITDHTKVITKWSEEAQSERSVQIMSKNKKNESKNNDAKKNENNEIKSDK